MIFVDSGYLMALAEPRDALHRRAVLWSRFVKESLLVTEQVVWETVNAMSVPVDRPKVHALIAQIRAGSGYEFVHATPSLLETGLHLHRARPDKAWSLTDCISFHIMRARSITKALSYDEHFEQAGFVALLRTEPQG